MEQVQWNIHRSDCGLETVNHGGAMDENQGFAASRGAGDDPAPPVVFPGDAFLVMVEELQAALMIGAFIVVPLRQPLRKIDARHGKDELAEVVQLPLGDGKAWFYRRHHYRFVMRGAGRPQLTRYRACPVGRRLSDRESPSLLSTVHLEVC